MGLGIYQHFNARIQVLGVGAGKMLKIIHQRGSTTFTDGQKKYTILCLFIVLLIEY